MSENPDFLMAVTWSQPYMCGVCGQILESVMYEPGPGLTTRIDPVQRRCAVLRCGNSRCEKYELLYEAPATLIELKPYVCQR